MKRLIPFYMTICLVGCGGGGSDVANDSPVNTPPPPPPEEIAEGGTLGSPGALSLSLKNEITADSVDNYFEIDLELGDRLYIYAVLDLPLTGRWQEQCVYEGTTTDRGIDVAGKTHACGYSLAYTAETTESVVVHFDFADGHTGYAFADIVKSGQRTVEEFTGKGGKPSAPMRVQLNEQHEISANSFNNFYAIEGKQSQTIVMTSYLDDTIGARLEAWCPTSYRDFSATRSGRAYGFSLDEEDYSCSRVVEYTFPDDGTYYLHVRYFDHYDPTAPISGHFIVEEK